MIRCSRPSFLLRNYTCSFPNSVSTRGHCQLRENERQISTHRRNLRSDSNTSQCFQQFSRWHSRQGLVALRLQRGRHPPRPTKADPKTRLGSWWHRETRATELLRSDGRLLDDPGHRFKPPGRTAPSPQRSVVECSGYPAQGRSLVAQSSDLR